MTPNTVCLEGPNLELSVSSSIEIAKPSLNDTSENGCDTIISMTKLFMLKTFIIEHDITDDNITKLNEVKDSICASKSESNENEVAYQGQSEFNLNDSRFEFGNPCNYNPETIDEYEYNFDASNETKEVVIPQENMNDKNGDQSSNSEDSMYQDQGQCR